VSAEAKRVKILTLLGLVLGLVLVVLGIVLVVGGSATSAPFVLIGEGVVTLVYGGRGALIANVPARMGKLVTLAAVVLLVQLACVAAVVMLVGPDNVSKEPVLVGASAVPSVVTLATLLLARGMTKRAER
jgi:hypothetical protein